MKKQAMKRFVEGMNTITWLWAVALPLVLCLGQTVASADLIIDRESVPKAGTENEKLSAWARPTEVQPDKDGFVPDSRPMDGPTLDESIPAAPLVAGAYGVLWLSVFGYLLFSARGIRKMEQDVAELEAKISRLQKVV